MNSWLSILSFNPSVSKPKRKAVSSKTMASYKRNSHRNCAEDGCTRARHLSASGNCHTTMCKMHYLAQQTVYRMRYKSSLVK